MKPPAFDYLCAGSVEEVLDVLHDDPGAKIIAGGQSLVPLLNLRLAQPTRLIDVNRLPGLDNIESNGSGLRIGALVRHTRLLSDPQIAASFPLLTQAAHQIGHPAIRNRGTFGGSIVHADPTAELPAAAVALDATFRVRSREGERNIPAREFFQSSYLTELQEEEMLVETIIPARPAGEGAEFLELTMREGDFAVASVAALTQVEDGLLRDVRIVWSGADFRPVSVDALTEALEGMPLEDEAVGQAIAEAAEAVESYSDIHATAEYRRNALRVLTERALRGAAERARNQGT